MARLTGINVQGTFPYANDLMEAPYTDGIIGGGLNANYMMGTPDHAAGNTELLTNQGTMIDGGMKDSSITYVNCNRIWYPIFAGDF